jgi:hypothetical protein
MVTQYLAINHRYELFKTILVVAYMKYSDGPRGITSILDINGIHFLRKEHSNKSILYTEF